MQESFTARGSPLLVVAALYSAGLEPWLPDRDVQDLSYRLPIVMLGITPATEFAGECPRWPQQKVNDTD